MFLGVVSAASSVVAAFLLLRLHLLPTGLQPIRDAVSDYGRTPFHRNYRVMVVLLGVAAATLALGLGADTDAGSLYWLWIFAGCRVAIAWFMTDERSSPATPQGRVHTILAMAAFASIAMAAANVRWSGEAAVIAPLGTAVWISAAVTLAALLIPRARSTVFGLAERALYVSMIAWLLAAAATYWN